MSKKIAVVTGGNRGIGFEVCKQLASNGITTILSARDSHKGEQACALLQSQGLDVHFHPLDVGNEKSIKQLHQHILKHYDRLDILINNAGIFIDKHHSALHAPLIDIRNTLETNLLGAIQLTQLLIPIMLRNNYGRIVNVSSRMGMQNTIGTGALAYRLSKLGINTVTQLFAAELINTNIHINSMSPGWVNTDMGGTHTKRTVAEGADTITWLALQNDDGPRGKFFVDRKIIDW